MQVLAEHQVLTTSGIAVGLTSSLRSSLLAGRRAPRMLSGSQGHMNQSPCHDGRRLREIKVAATKIVAASVFLCWQW
eukprot:2866481-Amphidinium_carterae.1